MGAMSFHFQKKDHDLYPLSAKRTAKCFGVGGPADRVLTPLLAGNPGLIDAPFKEDGRFLSSIALQLSYLPGERRNRTSGIWRS
jgi:hypothetical protein